MIHTTQICKIGDSLKLLKDRPSESIDTIVTSPPYWGLRNYNVDGQIGMEDTLEEYHERLLEITAELKRVMKDSAVLWWNHGDSYGGSGNASGHTAETTNCGKLTSDYGATKGHTVGLMPKCMLMQNHRLIMRMIDEQGFILRNILIWSKSNNMPSSVRDRFSNKYEPVYMLVKQRKYWFDLDAVRIPAKYAEVWSRKGSGKDTPYDKNNPRSRYGQTKKEAKRSESAQKIYKTSGMRDPPGGGEAPNAFHPSGMKNPGDVVEVTKDEWLNHCADIWDMAAEEHGDIFKIPTQPHSDAHFAIFPDALVERLIKAACPPEICSKCGFIRERITEREVSNCKATPYETNTEFIHHGEGASTLRSDISIKTIGWTTCECDPPIWIAGTVLDPFAGSGTVGLVSRKLNRNAILLELNPEYGKIIEERTMAKTPPLTAYFGGD